MKKIRLLPFILIGLFTVTVISKTEFYFPKKGIEKIIGKVHHITYVTKKSENSNDSNSLLTLNSFSLKHDHLIAYKLTLNSLQRGFRRINSVFKATPSCSTHSLIIKPSQAIVFLVAKELAIKKPYSLYSINNGK